MNTHKTILLLIICLVLLIALIGCVAEYFKHKKVRRLIAGVLSIFLIYGLLFYLAYNG